MTSLNLGEFEFEVIVATEALLSSVTPFFEICAGESVAVALSAVETLKEEPAFRPSHLPDSSSQFTRKGNSTMNI